MTGFEGKVIELLTQIQANTRRAPPGITAPRPKVEPNIAFVNLYGAISNLCIKYVPGSPQTHFVHEVREMLAYYQRRFDKEVADLKAGLGKEEP